MDQLVEAFTIERIGKAGAKFDILKAQWYNQQYLKAKSDEELIVYLLDSLALEKIECSKETALKICSVMKERVTFPQDFWLQGKFFFQAPTAFDEQVVAKKWNDDVVNVLSTYRDALSKLEMVTAEVAKSTLEAVTANLGIATGKILQALRISITGGASGPDLMMTMEILGKNEVVNRIEFALKNLKIKVV